MHGIYIVGRKTGNIASCKATDSPYIHTKSLKTLTRECSLLELGGFRGGFEKEKTDGTAPSFN